MYRQSGVAILSYFARVIETKYEGVDVGVTIEQNGNQVTLVVETPEGRKEAIEQTLTDYGEVILGRLAPEALFGDSQPAILELKQELRLAEVRIQGLEDIRQLQSSDIQDLKNLLAHSIQRSGQTVVPITLSASATAAPQQHLQIGISQNLSELGTGLAALKQLLPEPPAELLRAEKDLLALEGETDPGEVKPRPECVNDFETQTSRF